MSTNESFLDDNVSFYKQNLVLRDESVEYKKPGTTIPISKTKTTSAKLKPTENHKVESECKGDDVPPVAFFHMFKYASTSNRFMYLLGLVSAICTGLTVPANSLLIGNLVNGMVEFGKTVSITDRFSEFDDILEAVETFAIKSTIIAVVMLVCSYISVTLFNYAAQDQILRIRGKFFNSILHQDMSWFDFNQSGEIASRMNEDLAKMEEGMGEKVVMFMHFLIAFLGSIALAFVKGWQLALVCLSSLPVTFIAMGFISVGTSKLAKEELNVYALAGNIAQEALSAIRTVKAFEGEYKEVQAYKDQVIHSRILSIKRNLFSGLGFGLLWLFMYSSYGLAFWYGTGLILKNYAGIEYYSNYDVGTMITVFLSVMMGSMNIGLASPYVEAFGIAKGACAKIFKLIQQKPIINPIEMVGQRLNEPFTQLEFRYVEFSYPTRPEINVLNELNIKINHGQTVALVGSSGCGKSTCIQLMQRFYDPTAGEVYFNGVNVKELDVNWLRARIGVVGQEPVLFATTIYENIRYGYEEATAEQVEAAARTANALQFIKKLPNGFHTLVGERGAQLSGGQKQRIAIARALIRDPEILLLDEATSALDAESERLVQNALEMASKGRTTVIVAHRLSTIRRADRIMVLSEGKEVESGTHDDLMALKEQYYNLVMRQLGEDNSTVGNDSKYLSSKANHAQDYMELSQNADNGKLNQEIEDENRNFSIWSILKLNAPEWLYILCGSLTAFINGTAIPLFSILFGNIMQVFSNDDTAYIRNETNTYSLYFVICGIVVGVGTFLQIYSFGIAGEKLTERLRCLSFESMLKMEVAWFDDRSNGMGSLCARLSGDAAAIQGATGQRIGTVLQSLSTMCFGIALAMYYEWSLGLVALSFTPLIFVAMFYQRKIMAQENMGTGKSMEKCTKLSVDAVSNIRTVVSLGLENLFHKQYMEKLLPAVTRAKRNTHLRGIVFGAARALMFFAYAACMYYGKSLVVNKGLPFGDVFKVAHAVIMGATNIASALAFAPNFQRGLTAAKNIYQLLMRQPKISDRVDVSTDPWYSQGDVAYEKVKFSYPTRPESVILQDLNLNVYKGQKVALVGASGCGKSTCIQLLQRFYDVDDGSVTLDSCDVRNISSSNLRKQLGIVSQEPVLFDRTIYENIAYGDNSRLVSMPEVIEAAKKANIHNFITSLPTGYETRLGEKGTQLSGGQKQRVAIARALIRNPKVLLLDEATSALDAESERIVQDALAVASEGRTTVSIAHRLATIIDADVIFVFDNGHICESGTHNQLLEKRGLYYTLYKLQTGAI